MKLTNNAEPIDGSSPGEQAARELRDAFGADVVRLRSELGGEDFGDWSDTPWVTPVALLLPRSTSETSALVQACSRSGLHLVVQGGRTGLTGGAAVGPGEVALSLRRLDRVDAFDEVSGTVVVGAGLTLQAMQELAESKGWYFPLDLGARGSCQLGGNAATNAGGNRVVRFGMMREAILGLEVVLPDGTVLEMLNQVVKNNAGYDLKHLFIGTEGTLGIITRLALRLSPLPSASKAILCAVPDFPAATKLLRTARTALPEMTAFELMWADFVAESCAASKSRLPFDFEPPLYVLIEAQGSTGPTSDAMAENFLEAAATDGLALDAIVSQSDAQARRLWDIREGIGEMLSSFRPHAAFDVSAPLSTIEKLVETLRHDITQGWPQARKVFFGHLGDGNLHCLVGPLEGDDALLAIERLVYERVGEVGGSISAEHGIGVVKRDFLHHSRNDAELLVMKQLKALFDPQGLLNAGRVFATPGLVSPGIRSPS